MKEGKDHPVSIMTTVNVKNNDFYFIDIGMINILNRSIFLERKRKRMVLLWKAFVICEPKFRSKRKVAICFELDYNKSGYGRSRNAAKSS